MVSASGALSGAAKGGLAGAAFGPWGAGIGGGIGLLNGLFGGDEGGPLDKLFGSNKNGKMKKLKTMDPRQRSLYKKSFNSLLGKGRFADQFKFDKKSPFYNIDPNSEFYKFNAQAANENFNRNVAAPAYEQFQQNIIPGITGQFRLGGLENSSYVGQALSNAGRDVQRNLDTQRANALYAGQQQTDMRKYNDTNDAQNRAYTDFNNIRSARQNQMNNLLGLNTFDYSQPTQQKSIIDQALSSLAPQAGEVIGKYLGGIGNSTKSRQVSSMNNL